MSRRRWPKCWCWSNGPLTPDTLARYGSNPPSVSGRSKLGSTISRSGCGSRPHGEDGGVLHPLPTACAHAPAPPLAHM